jgi:hypothetical protein
VYAGFAHEVDQEFIPVTGDVRMLANHVVQLVVIGTHCMKESVHLPVI